MAYKHGIYIGETATAHAVAERTDMVQFVIGTAPVYMTDSPAAKVNTPILCRSMSDCMTQLGFSDNFDKYTLCESMYMNFARMGALAVVFVNVLDIATHKTAVTAQSFTIANGSVVIDDAVIVSSLDIKQSNTAVPASKYTTAWADGKLVISFDDTVTGSVDIAYDKADPTKVTAADVIGAYNTATETRTGLELINAVYPRLGVIPYVITAPKWSENDTVGAIMAAKAKEINTSFKGIAIMDISSSAAVTRAAAITAKEGRTWNECTIAAYPMVEVGSKTVHMSTLIAAVIMKNAALTGGMTCTSPSNTKVSIDNPVLASGEAVYYDTDEGNVLNEAGIVTVIARNGWFVWGNNTAAYPEETDPVNRWIMTRLSFAWIENDFIANSVNKVDKPLSPKIIEDLITDENIRLAGYAASGYIIGGSMSYDPADNSADTLLAGQLTCRTSLAANVPGEVITNIFSFDTELLTSSITGGEA